MRNARFYSQLYLALGLLCSSSFISCQRNDSGEGPTRGKVAVMVSEDIAPVLDATIREFQSTYEETKITLSPVSNREAIAYLLNDSVTVIAVSRPMTTDEDSVVKAYSLEVDQWIFSYDGVLVYANDRNPVSQLTSDQLRKVFSSTATTWRNLGIRSPAEEIVIAIGGKNSGMREYLSDRFRGGKPLQGQMAPCTSSTHSMAFVAKNPGAIGFVSSSWLRHDSLPSGLHLVKIGDPDFRRDSTTTTLEYFTPHPYYLHRNLYPMKRSLILYARGADRSVGIGLIAFINGAEGQKIITRMGLLTGTMPVRFVQHR